MEPLFFIRRDPWASAFLNSSATYLAVYEIVFNSFEWYSKLSLDKDISETATFQTNQTIDGHERWIRIIEIQSVEILNKDVKLSHLDQRFAERNHLWKNLIDVKILHFKPFSCTPL